MYTLHESILSYVLKHGRVALDMVDFYQPSDPSDPQGNMVREVVWNALSSLSAGSSTFKPENVYRQACVFAKMNNKDITDDEISLYIEMLSDIEQDADDFIVAVSEYQLELMSRSQRMVLNQITNALIKPLHDGQVNVFEPAEFTALLEAAMEEWRRTLPHQSKLIDVGAEKEKRIAELKAMYDAYKNGETVSVVGKTGYEMIDAAMPLLPGSQSIVAGHTGHGKTSLVLNLLRGILRTAKVLLISLEMSPFQLDTRLGSIVSFGTGHKVNFSRAVMGEIDDTIYAGLASAYETESFDGLYIAAIGRAMGFNDGFDQSYADEIVRITRKAREQYGVDVVILDHAQLINVDHSKTPFEVRRISHEMTRLGVAAIILNQANKTGDFSIDQVDLKTVAWVNPQEAVSVLWVQSDAENSRTLVKVLKARFGSQRVYMGQVGTYNYDRDTGTLTEYKTQAPAALKTRINGQTVERSDTTEPRPIEF